MISVSGLKDISVIDTDSGDALDKIDFLTSVILLFTGQLS